MPKIYLSPSTQESNVGVSPYITEEKEMNLITDLLVPILVNDGRFTVKRNSTSMTPYQSASASNAFRLEGGLDTNMIHVAIHSNAGGGIGSEVFAYGVGTNSERLAKALYDQISPISPNADRGVKYKPALIEVGDTVKATAVLIELAFHDNAGEALWMVNNRLAIAQAIYKGICDYYGYKDYRSLVVAPPSPAPEPSVTPTVMYRVLLDGKQAISLSSEADALANMKNSIDTGIAVVGIVQRNDGVNLHTYTKPVVVAPIIDTEKEALKTQVASLQGELSLVGNINIGLQEQLRLAQERVKVVDEWVAFTKKLLS